MGAGAGRILLDCTFGLTRYADSEELTRILSEAGVKHCRKVFSGNLVDIRSIEY